MKLNVMIGGALISFSLGSAAHAQATAKAQVQPNAKSDPPPTVILIRPAAEPNPALKYRLVPERRELVPGNAALFYHRAILMLMQKRVAEQIASKNQPANAHPPAAQTPPESPEMAIARLSSCLVAEFNPDEARKLLEPYETTLHEVELGAIRQTCDWEFDLRKEGIMLLLPEIQEMRSLARLVNVKIRLAVFDQKTDLALHWIQVQGSIARHVAEGPTIIQALVGLAITNIFFQPLEELIQNPGVPSLYWALAARPHPFIDLSQAVDGERTLLERELPSLNDLDSGPWSVDRARGFSDELYTKLTMISGNSPFGAGGSNEGLYALAMKLAFSAFVMKEYPEAKRALIAQGKSPAEVEATPAVQVVAIHSLRKYNQVRDDVYKWMSIPYPQAESRIGKAMWKIQAKGPGSDPLLAMFALLDPALKSVRISEVRTDRRLDAIECLEAIRMYASAHRGTFPETLEAMIDSPAPIDVATGKPFVYEKHGDSATLSAPLVPGAPDHPTFRIRYELKLVK
jgi:hypothetical protein